MSRVQVLTGTEPFLIIAPHGAKCDDYNTDIVSAHMAIDLGGYAIINTGWSRGRKPNYDKNIANLNSLRHCRNQVVQQEYIEPIKRFKDEIVRKHGICYQFLIHGMGNSVQRRTKDNVQVVAGYGQGDPPAYSCALDHKDKLLYLLNAYRLNAYESIVGGRFAAWHKDNVNQLWVGDDNVQSIQLELCPGLRVIEEAAINAGRVLAKIVDRLSYRLDEIPVGFVAKQC